MVTKRWHSHRGFTGCSVLAKIHMVTKQRMVFLENNQQFCSSKNSYGNKTMIAQGSVLLRFCSSKNSYGNKTHENHVCYAFMFCSSKNSYGNKTIKVVKDVRN